MMKDALDINGKVYRVSFIRKSEKLFKITHESVKTKRWFCGEKETITTKVIDEKTGKGFIISEGVDILGFLDDGEKLKYKGMISIVSNEEEQSFFYQKGNYIGRRPYVAFHVLGKNNGKDVSWIYIYIYETDEEAENAYTLILTQNPNLTQLKRNG